MKASKYKCQYGGQDSQYADTSFFDTLLELAQRQEQESVSQENSEYTPEQDNYDYGDDIFSLQERYDELNARFEELSQRISLPTYNGDDEFMRTIFDDAKTNEPFNLSYNPRTPQKSNKGFRVFDSPEEGRAALEHQLNLYKSGQSAHTTGNETLYEAMAKYAPAEDRNNPKAYAEFIGKKLGISPNTPIKQVDTKKWADAITIMEGNKSGNNPGNLRPFQQGGTNPIDFENQWLNSNIYKNRNVSPEITNQRVSALNSLGEPVKVTQEYLKSFVPKGSDVTPLAMYNGLTHKINITDQATPDVIGHETFHGTTKGDLLIPKSENINSEQRASLQNLRYGMYNNGIPVLDREINADDLKKMKGTNEYKYLKRIIKKDDDILNYLKSTSSIEEVDLTYAQNGGRINPIITNNPNDPRLRAYQDSLSLYNQAKNAIGNNGNSPLNTPVYTRNGVNPDEFNSKDYDFVKDQGVDITGMFQGNMNPNNNFPPPKVKQTIMPIGGIGINKGNSMGGWYNIYKKPVQPVVYKKEPTLQRMNVKAPVNDVAAPQFTRPQVGAVNLMQPQGEFNYRVEYTDPFTNKETHKDFPNERQGSQFQSGLQGNRTGYWLRQFGGDVSEQGYNADSPYKNANYLNIYSPTGDITLEKTPIDLLGISLQTGEKKVMKKGRKYSFKNSTNILEIPLNK